MARRKYFGMGKRNFTTLVSFLALLIILLLQQLGWVDVAMDAAEQYQPGTYQVVRYSDGDTIVVDMDGRKETIRFIGIDTPETHKPNTPVQCYGPAAAAHTKNLISAGGGRVRLAADSLGTNRDRYDRLLRYVYLPDGRFVNEINVRAGYAFYYPFFPFSKKDQFAAAQLEAQTAQRGLWGNCNPMPVDGGGYKME